MKTLALINEINDIKEILQKSLKFVKDDTLEVLFVHEEELFNLSKILKAQFFKDEKLDKEAIKEKIKQTLKELGYSKDAAILVYIGDTLSTIEDTQKDINPFIVTKYNKATRALAKSSFRVLFLKTNCDNYKNIVINVTLNDNDSKLIEFAKENFPDANIELVYDYIYIITTDIAVTDPLIGANLDVYLDEEVKSEYKKRFEELLKKYNLSGKFLEDLQNQEELITYINSNNFDLAIFVDDNRDLIDDTKIDSIVF